MVKIMNDDTVRNEPNTYQDFAADEQIHSFVIGELKKMYKEQGYSKAISSTLESHSYNQEVPLAYSDTDAVGTYDYSFCSHENLKIQIRFHMAFLPFPHWKFDHNHHTEYPLRAQYAVFNQYCKLELGTQVSPTLTAVQTTGFVLNSTLDAKTSFEKLTFVLANFPQMSNILTFSMSSIENNVRMRTFASLCVQFHGYELQLDPLPDTIPSNESQLSSGSLITHNAILRRTDDSSINYNDYQLVFTTIYWFCSFIAGRWCSPMLTKFYKDGVNIEALILPRYSSRIGPYRRSQVLASQGHYVPEKIFDNIAEKLHSLAVAKESLSFTPILLRWYFDCISEYATPEVAMTNCSAIVETVLKILKTHNQVSADKIPELQTRYKDGYCMCAQLDIIGVEHRIPHLWEDVRIIVREILGKGKFGKQLSIYQFIRVMRNKLYHYESKELTRWAQENDMTRERVTLLAQQLAEDVIFSYLDFTPVGERRDGLAPHMYG